MSTQDPRPSNDLVSAAAEVAALFRQYYWLSRGWPEVQRLLAATAPPGESVAVQAPASAVEPAADLPFTDVDADTAAEVAPRTRFIPDLRGG